MIDIFLNFFSDIFNVIVGFILMLVGILVGIVLRHYLYRAKNQVLYLRERDKRGLELNISKEGPFSVETHSNPKLRFFKYGGSYEFRKRGRAFTRFFGKEGTGYLWRLQGFSKVPSKFKEIIEKVPMINEKGVALLDEKGNQVFKEVPTQVPIEWKEQEVELKFPNLEAAVKEMWGEEFYSEVPEKMKSLLRDNRLFVTVNLEPGIVPEGYEPITESVIKKKAKEDAAELIGRSLKGATKKSITDWIFIFGAGAGAATIAFVFLGMI